MILVFCAFGAEYEPLRARLKNPSALEQATILGMRGEIGRSAVAVVVSGVGNRRARQSAAIALDNIRGVDGVIITGVAGGLHGDLKIGDVVIGERLLLRREEEFAASHTVEIGSARVDALAATLNAARIAHVRGAMLADEDGRVRIGAAARALIRDPRMIGASIRLMRNLRAATASMAVAIEAALSGRE